MTNKYSGLSDFELTKIVAKKLFENYPNITVGDETYRTKVGLYNNDNLSQEYDLFYDSSDAFDLMVNHDISLIKHPDFYDAVFKFGDYKPIRFTHEDPVRALAICFLLMKDAEKEDETKTL